MPDRQAPRRLLRTARARVAIVNGLRGLLMGSFDAVPGISGGTVALILGIFDRLIGSIRNIVDTGLGVVRADLPRARASLGAVEWWLVIPLAVGIAIAIASLARFIEPVLDEETGSPVQARAVFFGLVCGSLIVPWRRGGGLGGRRWLLAGAGAVLAFLFTGLPETEIRDPAYIAVFAAAAVAICALLLPGLSGAFVLLILGMYAPTLAALNDRDLPYLLIFGLGALTGLAVFSKILNWLLTHYHDATMAVALGLMIGSLRALWPYLGEDRGLHAPPAEASALVELGLAVGAFALVTGIITIARRKAGDRVVFGRPGDPVDDATVTHEKARQ